MFPVSIENVAKIFKQNAITYYTGIGQPKLLPDT